MINERITGTVKIQPNIILKYLITELSRIYSNIILKRYHAELIYDLTPNHFLSLHIFHCYMNKLSFITYCVLHVKLNKLN